MTSNNLRRPIAVLVLYFVLLAFGMASWIVRLPELREHLHLSTSQLGWVLFAGAVGSMATLSTSGRVIARYGARRAVIIGFSTVCIGQLIIASFVFIANPWGVAVGVLIMGAGFGIADVGINVDAAALEKRSGRSLMPQLHGAFSLGSLVGAGAGTLFIAAQLPLNWHMGFIAIGTVLAMLFTYRLLPAATGIDRQTHAHEPKAPQRRVLDKRIIFLGLGIMGLSIAEGGANDWLALSVVDDYGLDAATAGATFAVMTLAMVITRFTGGYLVDRYGRVFALRLLGIGGVIGILIVILSPTIYLAWIGAALWGAGVALGFPLFISAAADGENSSRRVATVTAFGYGAFLVGPPALGFIAQEWGLLNMFYIMAACVAAAVYFAGEAKPLASSTSEDDSVIVKP